MQVPTAKPELDLTTIDGNAFSILGSTCQALRKAGADEEYTKTYVLEATSSDYDHLVQTTMKYLDIWKSQDI